MSKKQKAVAQDDASNPNELPPIRNQAENVSRLKANMERAQQFKSEGNEHFKAKQYSSAIESYSNAITATPDNAVLYSNRAMARLKLREYELAESDCNQCLEIDEAMIKALFRRGLARKGLRKYNRALADFEQVLKLEPNNKAATKERAAMKTKLKAMLQRSRERQFGVSNAKNKKSAATSKRVVIEEGDDSDSDSSEHHGDAKREEMLESGGTAEEESKTESLEWNRNGIKRLKEEAFVLRKAPSNFIEFEKEWNRADTFTNRAQILLALKHRKLGVIIRNMIDDTLFSQMIRSVHHIGMEMEMKDALLILKQMTTLDRFEMIVMFMEKQEQTLLKELQQKCSQSELDVSVFAKFQ